MLLKIELDWENPGRMKDSTVSLIARVLEYQERANLDKLSCFYRLDVGELEWEGIYYPVKAASMEFKKLHIQLDDKDLDILNIPIASCQVVDDFPIPSITFKK